MSNLQENEDFRKIRKRLKSFRGILGLSREQLANESDFPVKTIEGIEKGVIKSNILLNYMLGLKRDFGLCFDWLIYGNNQPFTFQGPKTPQDIYENYKSKEDTNGDYIFNGVTLNDEQLLMDIISLMRVPEARVVLQGEVLILETALKKRIKAMKTKKYPRVKSVPALERISI